MNLSKTYAFLAVILLPALVKSQQKYTVSLLDSGRSVSLRGLSAPSDAVVWVSGNHGNVARSVDGGQHFEWFQVAGFEERDFRDIEAFDADTAVIMAIAEPAQILRTTDGGKHWKIVFTDSTKGMFLDAMSFWGKYGTVVGDPVNGRFFIAHTTDGGLTWNPMHPYMPEAENGEACFASSGTNLHPLKGNLRTTFLGMVTGGLSSRLHLIPFDGTKMAELTTRLPMLQGKESTGANSLTAWKQKWLIVGGDFTQPENMEGNCLISTNGGKNWQKPGTPPNGYRSCVLYLDKNRAITCGLNGIDVSEDEGFHWFSISTRGFHVVQKAKMGNIVYFAGAKGQIGKMLDIKN
ncbi:Uncharacterized protein SAMN05421788_11880 [Filimonas lacunae]|uniref:Photosynthesis system II assembly factor Ycf48/Hcf136-like domain-containing protein n=1 Tax=Filimonas lacunae TaxID=477680 RepID=A0A173MBE2_9BACT|nr:YCF48-related protein [Filimonas lacunae]BAV04801.1 oxidoreductase [Filimonas lacunae]SIT34750.1 Uncharacterized protein SAMN05421788_11880 [Filimonas lacunae]